MSKFDKRLALLEARLKTARPLRSVVFYNPMDKEEPDVPDDGRGYLVVPRVPPDDWPRFAAEQSALVGRMLEEISDET